MFGYRVVFSRSHMKIKRPDPKASQAHKPLQKFVKDIVNELNASYVTIPKYGTRRHIVIPVVESEGEDEEKSNAEGELDHES
jgi:uncharacterized protein with NRDE domain